MGCGPSHEQVISEILSVMEQLKQENTELQDQRDNLKLQQELSSGSDTVVKNSTSELTSLSHNLEMQLKEVKSTGVAFLPPNIPNITLKETILQTIDIQNTLDDISSKVLDLKSTIRDISVKKEEIIEYIKELEEKNKNKEMMYATAKTPQEIELAYYIDKVNKLEDIKNDLLNQVRNLETTCKKYSDEIFVNENKTTDEKPENLTYEHFLTMTDEEIQMQTDKVEKELKDLTDHLKKLKERELEIENLNQYVKSLEIAKPSRLASLRKEVEESRERVSFLLREKQRSTAEIEMLKMQIMNSGSKAQTEGLIPQRPENQIETPRHRLLFNSNVEETLKKAKNFTSVVRGKNL